ncbi:hypothetical protein [Halopseudomonas salegens]|uniref:Uncharacterized protein n=1 Tax=Halopseudomonas salegens TaxID=1434072 RepID=A0A1H2EIG0_9GAMM|nr:hypothetical protein [Halopseudomonas salegens]SDT94907.1 hypothetical protein SAMN05216210_0759 [Halopseudomonas salegens]
MTVDVKGEQVRIGSKVRVLSVHLKDLDCLPDEEVSRINSIVGQVLSVYDISSKYVSVKKVWEDGGVLSEGLSMNLLSNQIELVEF